MTRAVLEGVTFALRDSLTILQDLGMSPTQLLLTGGGAKSPFVRRLQAEVFGLPVSTVNREEGPAYGAALLAAVGAGAFADVASAVHATLIRSLSQPSSAAAHAMYEGPYRQYRASVQAARPDQWPAI